MQNQDDAAPFPTFTEADEVREKATLTQEDIATSTADMYGLAESLSNCTISEDDVVPEALYMLDNELKMFPRERMYAYLEAQQKCPDLVGDKHKETFLWSESLDPELAAERLIKYWELKREIFGPAKCFLPLTLLGALRDDVQAVSDVGMHVLPVKDAAGRVILYARMPDTSRCTHESLLRAKWYLYHAAFEDSEVQKRGAVLMFFVEHRRLNIFDVEFRRFFQGSVEIMSCFPGRVCALHFIQPDRTFHTFIRFGKFLMNKRLRQRIQIHIGSNEDVLESLSSFGMSPDQLPSDIGGNIILDQNAWVTCRSALEEYRTNHESNVRTQSSVHTQASTSRTHQQVDPRMSKAVRLKLDNPDMSLLEALLDGGFEFEKVLCRDGKKRRDQLIIDNDGVSLHQRKNHLLRRLRIVEKKLGAHEI